MKSSEFNNNNKIVTSKEIEQSSAMSIRTYFLKFENILKKKTLVKNKRHGSNSI